MDNNESLALFLARRQKRLAYWRAAFTPNIIDAELGREISGMLDTYALLLAKSTKQASEAEQKETRSRLLTTERELTGLFEARRLRTSTVSPKRPENTPLMKPDRA